MSKDVIVAPQSAPVLDREAQTRLAESLVMRGDISGLSPKERVRYYLHTCEELGLNPNAQPFAFLRLNGKEVMYPTRGATDQLARIHAVNREIVDGPRIMDLSGTKLLYAVCRASLPSGRVETATAAVPVPVGAEPIANAVMKVETKARRRATLAILGLALTDESEMDTIPASAKVEMPAPTREELAQAMAATKALPALAASADDELEEGAPSSRAYATFLDKLSGAQRLVLVVDLYAALLAGLREEGSSPEEFIGGDDGAAAQARKRILALGHRITKAEAMQVLLSHALAEILDDQAGIEPGPHALETAAEWWRANGARAKTLEQAHRAVPWYALARRYSGATGTQEVKRATTALESALSQKPPPKPPTGTDPAPSREPGEDDGADPGGYDAARAAGAVASAEHAWRETAEGITAHVATKGAVIALENSGRLHLRAIPEALVEHAERSYATRMERLSFDGQSSTPADECRATVARWRREGPRIARLPAKSAHPAAKRAAGGGL